MHGAPPSNVSPLASVIDYDAEDDDADYGAVLFSFASTLRAYMDQDCAKKAIDSSVARIE